MNKKILIIGAIILVIFLLLLKSNFLKEIEKQPVENLESNYPDKFPVKKSNICPLSKKGSVNNNDLIDKLRGA